ncbi:hypothetical protein Bca52824_031776 [Brassica carinata]|uniref:Uncharacterized protein n=1 Tax=Brassica carinata TaxID=52824 RepID=A0A8X7SAP0_BRACI|nr:hypothetical protein Bca52824_031776 [Brassica carinata]
MGWFVKERRGGAWKRGWLEETLFSSSAPPLTLLSLFAIISLLLFLSSYPRYKYEVEKTAANLKLFLLFLPILFVFLLVSLQFVHRILFRSSYYVRVNQAASVFGEGQFPWGVLLMLVLILLLVSKQSYFHSLWYPTI